MTVPIEHRVLPPEWNYGLPRLVDVYRIKTRNGGDWFRVWDGFMWMAGDNTLSGAARSRAACKSPDTFADGWRFVQ